MSQPTYKSLYGSDKKMLLIGYNYQKSEIGCSNRCRVTVKYVSAINNKSTSQFRLPESVWALSSVGSVVFTDEADS